MQPDKANTTARRERVTGMCPEGWVPGRPAPANTHHLARVPMRVVVRRGAAPGVTAMGFSIQPRVDMRGQAPGGRAELDIGAAAGPDGDGRIRT